MSIEGMWAAYFGDFAGQQVNSGIAVLETGRIFGGDSMMAYLGQYEVNDGVISGEIKIWSFNPHLEVVTAFGKIGTPEGSVVGLQGNINAAKDQIDGHLWEKANTALKIPTQLKKVAELPG
ncbi:GrlR family regulatory protein [Sphingomonas sp.]|uniref:GrlR family regulatory protein n=1 Tax=Sphingomonas sp. TaxID=28214 RepID=UPI0025DE894F|nr:GrlR family regulatory protein [Sphingomonas sp.]